MNAHIRITDTLKNLQAAGVSVAFHCTAHPLCIQRERIAEVCKAHNIAPVMHKPA